MMSANPIEEKDLFGSRIFNLNKYLVFIFSIILIMLLGFLDYITGYEISFSIFYLIPITIVIVLANLRLSIAISIISAISWYLADIHSGHIYQNPAIPVWNSIMWLGYYILHSVILGKALALYRKVKHEAITDPLTSAFNVRFFYELFDKELKKSNRTNHPFTLVYFDLDNFKLMNDNYGHQAGNSLLQLLSSLVLANIRPYDIFARMGGDEFVLLILETDFGRSDMLIRRIHDIVTAEIQKRSWPVTLSTGAVTCTRFDVGISDIIKKADDLMYTVKTKGKNNILHVQNCE